MALGVPSTRLDSLPGNDSFVLSVLNTNSIAAASSKLSMRGSILAVNRLLVEVGFQFLAPDETIVPVWPLSIDNKTDITFDSVFENRDNNEWPAESSPTWAGLIGYNGMHAHGSKGGFQKYAIPPGGVHSSYSLVAGPKNNYSMFICKRNGSGPCLGSR